MNEAEINQNIAKLGKGWFISGDGLLTATFKFNDFAEAEKFVVKVAKISDLLDHHPTITWSYKTVVISTITHETETLTDKDFELATKIQILI